MGLSKAYFELGDYYRSVIIILRNFERHLERPSDRFPEDLWLLAYPQGFWNSIVNNARRYGVDPFLVAAIIRQESQFHDKALSPAGARGVMQVMPATGAWIARSAGVPGFERSRLFDADVNIGLGAWYLSYLMKRFEGNIYLVSAAYNAGPGAVRSWGMDEARSDPAAFVEAIPYTETRGYVKKVLRNYDEYRRLYGGSAPAVAPAASVGQRAVQVCSAADCP
jgi:soluble lytic murein transglycosylase